ncbi:MAG: hypothetical protein ABR543_13015 [Gemmatimonadaceae bacterium]
MTPSQPYIPIPPRYAAVRGSVNLSTGTMTCDARPSSETASGLHAQIYGVQNVSVRLYNSTVQIDSITTPGVKRITTMVGIENLLGHSVGDEQAGLVPGDTMGVHVFFTDEPTVTSPSPCSSCSVAITNYHGTLAFTDLGQKYFHWPERLGAVGSITDTTLNRKLWTFESSAAVTNFTFTVLVNAAWPPPDETAWQVEYTGDSLPDTQAEPRWRRQVVGVGASATAGAGALDIAITSSVAETSINFQRRDSLESTTNAFAEARFSLNSGTSGGNTGFGFDDDTKIIQVGVSTTEAGFVNSSHNFIDKVSLTSGVFHVFQIRKFAPDSAQLWIDGARRLTLNYSAFGPSDVVAGIPSFFRFGSRATSLGGNESTWDYVIYKIGCSDP